MNIVGIILARGGSKRLPRKNVKMLCGKPLIAHTIEAGLKSKYINKVVVSTEDKEIAEISTAFGADVINRPMELAGDEVKSAPVMIHVVEELEKQGYNPDIVLLLQCTAPNKDESLIDEVIEKLINTDNDSVFTGVEKSYTMALWKKNHDGSMNALYDYHLRPRWQDVHLNEKIYSENGAVYAIEIDAFKKHQDFIGEKADIVLAPHIVDIDTEADFEKVEKLMMGE